MWQVVDCKIVLTVPRNDENVIAIAEKLNPTSRSRDSYSEEYVDFYWSHDALPIEQYTELKAALERTSLQPHIFVRNLNLIIPPEQMSIYTNENFSTGAIELAEDSLETWAATHQVNEIYR